MPKRIHYDPNGHQQTISDCTMRTHQANSERQIGGPYWYRDPNKLTRMYHITVIILFLVTLILSIGR